MAVKRVTIEIDDKPDMESGTTLPPSLVRKQIAVPMENQETGTPEMQEDYRERDLITGEQTAIRGAEAIGRTPSDLAYNFINRPQFMPTVLTLLSFLIFVGKLQKIDDFWMPICMSILLNSVWFGIVWIKKFFSWLIKR
jgi:hypothetical protein